MNESEIPKKKYRSQPTTATKRKWLSLYYEDKRSVKAIADDYGYPAYTVYRVLEKMNPDRKERSDKGKAKASPVLDIDFGRLALEGESTETKLEMMLEETLRAVSEKKKLTVNQVIYYSGQLTNSLRKLRSIQFRQTAKNLDVKIVEGIIRRYEPEATDLRIIEICKEVIAEAKSDNNS